jgi:hypothetical protein
MHPTKASLAGRGYSAANGTKIKNHGEQILKSRTEDGQQFSMAVQCADVTRTLGSVYRMNQGGNVIVFDGSNSYMVNKKSKKVTPIKQENGQYVMYIWVKDEESKVAAVSREVPTQNRFEALRSSDEDFPRQANK